MPSKPFIDRNDYEQRIDVLKQCLGTSPEDAEAIRTYLSEEQVAGNVENFVGAVPVPLGLCGPIDIRGDHARGWFVVPMATLEGTLVASYSRGAKVISESGGCEVSVYGDDFLRAAMLTTRSLSDAARLVSWCETRESQLRELAVRGSNHLRAVEIFCDRSGLSVLLTVRFTTGDAMGSNMTSKAIAHVAEYVTAESGLVRNHLVPYPEDKKSLPARRKGKRVIARAVLRRDVVESITRASLERIAGYITDYKNFLALHGAHALNIHAANGISAMFQAFGQDMAYLGECSQAVLDCRPTETGELDVSITIPNLILGSVGGGTGLPAFQAMLSMVDCKGDGKARKLAEIMGAVALAGEIGCAAAQCAHEFVAAHEALGRNRPT